MKSIWWIIANSKSFKHFIDVNVGVFNDMWNYIIVRELAFLDHAFRRTKLAAIFGCFWAFAIVFQKGLIGGLVQLHTNHHLWAVPTHCLFVVLCSYISARVLLKMPLIFPDAFTHARFFAFYGINVYLVMSLDQLREPVFFWVLARSIDTFVWVPGFVIGWTEFQFCWELPLLYAMYSWVTMAALLAPVVFLATCAVRFFTTGAWKASHGYSAAKYFNSEEAGGGVVSTTFWYGTYFIIDFSRYCYSILSKHRVYLFVYFFLLLFCTSVVSYVCVSEYKLLWALSCFIAAIITFNGKLFLFAIYLFIASGLVDGFFRLTSWRAIYRALLAAPDFYTQWTTVYWTRRFGALFVLPYYLAFFPPQYSVGGLVNYFFFEKTLSVLEYAAYAFVVFFALVMFFAMMSEHRATATCAFFWSLSVLTVIWVYMADYRYSCVESFKEGSHYILDWADDLWLGSSGSLVLGFDYIALLLCAMTGVVFMFVFLSLCAPHQANKSGLVLCLVLTEILVLTAFISYNIFVFFVCFEAAAIPMFLAIAHYGSTNKRTFAAAQFAGYTVLSSAFAFPGVLMLYYKFNTANYLYMLGNLALLSASDKIILFVVFGLAFAVKTPLVPFHSWLLSAHVEAPTEASIVLASVMLKLGAFGIIRFLFGLVHTVCKDVSTFVLALCLVGIIWSAIAAIGETDAKRLVAYTSIAHMSLAVAGLFLFNEKAFYGAVFFLIGHAVTSFALFFLIGAIYDRTKTRHIFSMGGLVQIMPLASSFLFIFVMLNAGFPLSLSFYAEFLVLSALFVKCGALYIALLGASFVLLLYANIRLFTHICLGSVDPRRVSPASRDLSTIELYISALSFVYGANLFFNNEYYFWPLYLSSYGRYYI